MHARHNIILVLVVYTEHPPQMRERLFAYPPPITLLYSAVQDLHFAARQDLGIDLH